MLRVISVSLSLLAFFFCYSPPSYAAINDPDPAKNSSNHDEASFTVEATISNGCEFDKSSYDLPLTVVNSTLAESSSVAVNLLCTLGSEVSITMDQGLHSNNNQRRLINANSQYIDYTLNMSEDGKSVGTNTLRHRFDNPNSEYKFYLKATADITNAQSGQYSDIVTFIISI